MTSTASEPVNLLCVSFWMWPPVHRLPAKLEDFRASLSLTSSSTRCRSLDASDWDSSSKSPANFRELSSHWCLTDRLRDWWNFKHQHSEITTRRKLRLEWTLTWVIQVALGLFTPVACSLSTVACWTSTGCTRFHFIDCTVPSLLFLHVIGADLSYDDKCFLMWCYLAAFLPFPPANIWEVAFVLRYNCMMTDSWVFPWLCIYSFVLSSRPICFYKVTKPHMVKMKNK